MVKMMTTLVSSLMIYSKNQMSLVLLIMGTCLLLSTTMFLMTNIHWFSLLLLLIYISGIMVLFMFIVSLCPNEKSSTKSKKMLIFMVSITTILLLKPMMISDNLKMNSTIEWSMMAMSSMTLIIMLMAYMPPKMMKSFYKGMKSTK